MCMYPEIQYIYFYFNFVLILGFQENFKVQTKLVKLLMDHFTFSMQASYKELTFSII